MFNASETFSDLELELMKIIWLWQCVRQYCNSWGTQRFKQFFYSLLKFWLEIWIRIFCKWETLFIFVQIRHLILSKLFDFKSGIVCLFYDMFEMAFFSSKSHIKEWQDLNKSMYIIPSRTSFPIKKSSQDHIGS